MSLAFHEIIAKKLHEDVAIDTYFLQIQGADGSTCAQLYVSLTSRMINVYLMPSKASCHILKTYQDFMWYESIPECLHRDLAPEQKSDKMTEINQNMMVKDSFSEAGNPNQNPAESLGVRVVKSGAETLMNRTGTPAQYWP